MSDAETSGQELAEHQKKISGPIVVGIGASAGGLSALRRLFELIPADTGLVFVVVVHLSPEHKSMLADLLQPSVKFPIQQVTETIPLQPNNVYVIPPNCNLNSIDTHLRLSALEERRSERAPIDHFFRTLAATHDGHAIGVILTGTGSDGTLGLREIKAKGGLVLVQDPNDAEFDGMPQSAITTGVVDRILPLDQIASTLVRLAEASRAITPKEVAAEQAPQERLILPRILAVLKARTERDFSRYKPATILRRTARRMQLNYIADFGEYLELLRDRSDEAHALADDLLITVTSFFRDPDVFQRLERDIIPKLFDGKSSNDSLRAWSVGCATGEEAYSITMLLLEESARRTDPPKLQVFASDLHKRSLDGAREGFYPGDIETDVSPERLQRFFRKENGGYRILKEVRDLVVFAPHNLLGDPPFSRIDLISCRNLLIYLDRSVQRDVIDLFHYSLCLHGYLLLGSAETTDALDLFRTEDKKLCIYQKRNLPAPGFRLPVFPLSERAALPLLHVTPGPLAPALPLPSLHQDLLNRYGPASILVGPDNKVLHLSDQAGRYLIHPGGEVTTQVMRLLRPELRMDLQSMLHTARRSKAPLDSPPIPVRFDDEASTVIMRVRPAQASDQEGFVLVVFEEHKAVPGSPLGAGEGASAPGPTPAEQRVLELDSELVLSRHRLQATVEAYEATQEEMKAANEEMQSINEELRSTMEELETSKEELQSINEELQTVNQENRHKVDELFQLSGDLQNLLASTGIATLFLDRELRILRYTPGLAEIFNIRVTDRGRPLSDLTHRLGHHHLQEDALTVLEHLTLVEAENQDDRGRWYLTRVLPYRNTEGRVEGVVITFIDITERKVAEQALSLSENRFRALVTAGSLPTYRMSRDWRQMYQLDGNGVLADATQPIMNWVEQYIPPEDQRTVQGAIEHAIRNKSLFELEHRVRRADGSIGWVLSRAVPMLDDKGEITEWFGAGIDVTAIKEAERQLGDAQKQLAEQALRDSEKRFSLLVENVQEYALFQADLEGRITSWNPGAERIFGYSRSEIIGKPVDVLFIEEDRQSHLLQTELANVAAGRRGEDTRWVRRKDGQTFWAQWTTEPILDDDGRVQGVAKVLRDETERKQYEERQALLMAELNHRVKNTLATVQSLANQTLRNTPDPAVFAEKFQERLWALSRAHTVLTRRSWESADVAEIVREQVYTGHNEENITAAGPSALLSPQAAVALSLVLHELTTNARKYGSLSQPGGRLSVEWKVSGAAQALDLEWAETGGPPVQFPEKRGFGTLLIERSLGGVGGAAQTRFEPGGLLCSIRLPLVSAPVANS